MNARVTVMQNLVSTDRLPDELLSALSGREATLWLHRLPAQLDSGEIARLIALPWRDVLLGESTEGTARSALTRRGPSPNPTAWLPATDSDRPFTGSAAAPVAPRLPTRHFEPVGVRV